MVTHFPQVSPTLKSSTTSPKDITGTRKTAQPLRTPVSLEDDFDFINSAHIMWLTTASNSSTVISIAVFWFLLGTRHSCEAPTYRQAGTYTKKNKYLKISTTS